MELPHPVYVFTMPDGLAHYVIDVTKIDGYTHEHTWALRCGGYQFTKGGLAAHAEAAAVTCLECAVSGPMWLH